VQPGDEPVALEGDVLSLAPRQGHGGAIAAGLLFDGSASPKLFALAVDGLVCTVAAWQQPLEPSDATVAAVLALPDGGLAVGGWIPGPDGPDDRDAWIVRYGPAGEPLWQLDEGEFLYVSEELQAPSREAVQALAWTGDGLIAAGAADINEALHSNWVLKLDGEGRLLSRIDLPRDDPRVPGELVALAAGSDGSLWLAGALATEESGTDAWLLRLDAQADLLWDRRYGEPGPQAVQAATVFSANGGLALAFVGWQGEPRQGDAWIAAVDGEGTPLWSNVLKRQAKGSESFAAVQAAGGGLAAGGRFGGGEAADQAWISHFDSQGRQSSVQTPAAGSVQALLPWGASGLLAGGSDAAGQPFLFVTALTP